MNRNQGQTFSVDPGSLAGGMLTVAASASSVHDTEGTALGAYFTRGPLCSFITGVAGTHQHLRARPAVPAAGKSPWLGSTCYVVGNVPTHWVLLLPPCRSPRGLVS